MVHPKILIIDDEYKALALLKLSLEANGCVILTAADGASGIAVAIRGQPGIIVLDIRLPDITGWEVCKILKSLPATRSIPVMFYTAYSSETDLIRAREAGATGYLVKPVDPDKMLKILVKTIEKKEFVVAA